MSASKPLDVNRILRNASSEDLQRLHDGLHRIGFVERRPDPQAGKKPRPKRPRPNPCKPDVPAGSPPEPAERELVVV